MTGIPTPTSRERTPMMTAEAVAVCARCGEPLTTGMERCPVCSGAVARSVLPPVAVGPLISGASPASSVRRALSCAVSVAVVLAAAALAAVVAAPLGTGWAIASSIGAAVVVGAGQLGAWLRTGRATGNLVTSTRTVSADDGSALSLRRLRLRRRPHTAGGVEAGPLTRLLGAATVVIGPGDPLALAGGSVPTLPPPIPEALVREASAPTVTLIFDGRVRIPLLGSTVLGRNPPPSAGDTVVALPDLSRSISKSHVRLDREGARVFIQDLGSTNGTELVTAEGTFPLASGSRVEVPAGARVLLAGVPLTLEAAPTGVTA